MESELLGILRSCEHDPFRLSAEVGAQINKVQELDRKLMASFQPADYEPELEALPQSGIVNLPGLELASREMLRTAVLLRGLMDRIDPSLDYSALAGFWKAFELECNRSVVDAARAAIEGERMSLVREQKPRNRGRLKLLALMNNQTHVVDLGQWRRNKGLTDVSLGGLRFLLEGATASPTSNQMFRWITPGLSSSSSNFVFDDLELRTVIAKVVPVRNLAAHTGVLSRAAVEPIVQLLSDVRAGATMPQLVQAKRDLQKQIG